VKARRIATVYHLPTDRLRAVLATIASPRKQTLPPQEGLVSRGQGQREAAERPRFSDEERAAFWRTVKLLKGWDWEIRWRPLWEREAPPEPEKLIEDGPMPWEAELDPWA
jgi:hypothetical protein